MTKKIIVFSILLCLNLTLLAQQIQVFLVTTPPSLALNWLKDPQPMRINVISPTSGAGPYKVKCVVTKEDKTVMITKLELTNEIWPKLGLNTYLATDFWTKKSFGSIDYSDVDVTTSKFNPGLYQICVSLIDKNGQTVGSEGCTTFQMSDFQEPSLILPQEDAIFPEIQIPGALMFRWSLVTPYYSRNVDYRLEIFEMQENMSVIMALAGTPILREDLNNNIYLATNFKQKLDQRKIAVVNNNNEGENNNSENVINFKYLWRVRAIEKVFDGSGNIEIPIGRKAGDEQGYSEIGVFTIQSTYGNIKSLKSELDNKPKTSPTAPIIYSEPTLITPKNKEKLDAELAYENIEFEWTAVTPQYPSLVKYLLKVYEVKEDQNEKEALSNAPIISKELNGETNYNWKRNIYSKEDTKFYWSVQALDDTNKPIGKKTGTSLGFSETGSFTVNKYTLKGAVPLFPINNSNVSFDELKRGVEFKWKGVTPKLSNEYKYTINIYEKINKKNELVAEYTIIDTLKYIWKNETLNKEGNYFWNITSKDSADNPIETKKNDEGVSEDFSFTLKEAKTKEITAEIPNCKGEKKVIKTTVKYGLSFIDFSNQLVTINTFTMKITELTSSVQSESSYKISGNGSIVIPWLLTPIQVSFNDITVDGSSMTVIKGNIFGLQDETMAEFPKILESDKIITKKQAKELNERLNKNAKTKMVLGQNIDDNISKSNIPKLPMGLNNDLGYTLAITEMKFSPQSNKLVCVAVLPINKDNGNDVISFCASNIEFDISTPSKGGGKLGLLEDFNIVDPAEESYGITIKAKNETGLATYIEWDCKGFKMIKTTVNVDFPRSWLIPISEEAEEEVSETEKVKGTAIAEIQNLNDWILNLSLDNCEINGLDGSELSIKNIYFDNSDKNNPPEIKFPKGFTGSTKKDFRGFYIDNASLTLPKFYNKSTDTTGISIAVDNFIITKSGVSGSIEVGDEKNPIVNLETGTVGEFQASLEKIEITFLNKSLTKAEVSGRMVLPICKSTSEKKNTLKYAASWNTATKKVGSSIQLTVKPDGKLNAELFGGAVLTLKTTSYINLNYVKKVKKKGKDNIIAEVKLNGNISIAKRIKDKVDVGFEMGFENLGFDFNNNKQKSFTMKPTTFSFASPQKKMAGFPVTFKEVKIIDNPEITPGYLASAVLEFDLNVNLGSSISGTAKLLVIGGIKKEHYVYIPALIDADVKEIKVKACVSAAQLDGSLVFYYKDPIYGDGFKGNLEVTFPMKIVATAAVQFGTAPQAFPKTGTYDYWFVQAKLILAKTIPIINPIGLKGGGIGAWHHMTASDIPLDTNIAKEEQTSDVKDTLCGAKFTPNENIGLGFSLTGIIANVQSDRVFNGDVTFTAEFNNNFGINLIQLDGSMYMGAELTQRNDAMVKGTFKVNYDFGNDIFNLKASLSFKVPKQAPDALALIKTRNPITFVLFIDGKNKKGSDPTWRLEIGTPTTPCEIDLKIGVAPVPAKFYLRAGNDIVAKVGFWESTIKGVNDAGGNLQNPKTPESNGALTSIPNGGFDFGVGFIAKGEANCGPFYGGYTAGAEVFMAIQKSARGGCVTDQFNYWYANGGIAAFATAEIGFRGLITVRMGGSANMFGGAPDPVWIKGGVSGQVVLKILFVNLDFKANVPFAFGTPCYPTTAYSLGDVDITDLVRISVRDYSTKCDNTLTNKINNKITDSVDDRSPFVVSTSLPLHKQFPVELKGVDKAGKAIIITKLYKLNLVLTTGGNVVGESKDFKWHQTAGTDENGPHEKHAYIPCIMPIDKESDVPGICNHEKYITMDSMRFNYIIGNRCCWNVSEIRNTGNVKEPERDRYRNFLFKNNKANNDDVSNTYLKNTSYTYDVKVSLIDIELPESDNLVYFPATGDNKKAIQQVIPNAIKFTTKSQ